MPLIGSTSTNLHARHIYTCICYNVTSDNIMGRFRGTCGAQISLISLYKTLSCGSPFSTVRYPRNRLHWTSIGSVYYTWVCRAARDNLVGGSKEPAWVTAKSPIKFVAFAALCKSHRCIYKLRRYRVLQRSHSVMCK